MCALEGCRLNHCCDRHHASRAATNRSAEARYRAASSAVGGLKLPIGGYSTTRWADHRVEGRQIDDLTDARGGTYLTLDDDAALDAALADPATFLQEATPPVRLTRSRSAATVSSEQPSGSSMPTPRLGASS